MFSGYKDAQPFYNNQPLFENRSQASFLPGDTSKQTSAPPWDYTQQSFNTVPCYTGDQNLNHRHTGPIHNQVVSQFDNSNVLTHYKNIGTGNNNHQSVVRPRAVINCQSNCNACYNHSVGRIPSHWNPPTDSVHYVHGNSSGSLATEEVSRYAPNLSNFSQHEETSNHFQTGFTAPLNKLSRFSKDSTTSASKTDVLSPTEDCNVLRNPPPSDSATVKKDVSATCHGVCNRGKCKFYQHQTIKFPSLEPIPIQQYGVPRENVVRYTGHNSGNSSCNQWPSHQPPGFWLQNGRPGFWMPPTDNVRNIPNSGMTNFWGDNGCEMPNQQLPPPPPPAPTSFHDITTNKGIIPIRNQLLKDVPEENKIHQYQEGPPRYTEIMQRKFPEEVQCRPHDALADCGIIQDPQYKPQNNKDIPRPTNNSSMESRSHSNLNGVNEVLSNFPASRSFSSYHKPKVPSTSSNFSTVLGIAQPPSRFSSDPTYTQSKISRSNNYMRFFSENNIDDTYNHSNDIVGSNFTSKITGNQHMPVHVPGKDVQSHGLKCLPPRNTESIIRYGGEITSDQLQSCGQMSDNGAQYHGMNTMQVIENNPSCSMSGTTCSPPNRREPGYHPGMSNRGDMFYSRQSLESYDRENYSSIHSKVGVISRSTKEACDLNLPSMYVPTDKPQLVPLLEDPSINRPIKKRRPRSKHERWSHDHNQQMSAPVLDVRQFLATWDEEADDLSPAGPKLPDVVLSNSSAENPLLVLDCRNLNTNGVATLSAVDRNTISEGNVSENVIHMYHQQISPSASNIINDSGPEKSNTDSEIPSGSLEDCPSLIPIEPENNSCIKQLPTGKITQQCNVQEGKNNQSKCNGAPNESERSFTRHIYSSSMKFVSENSSSVVQNSRTPSEGNTSNSDIAALQHNLQVGSNLNLTEECVNSETCVEDDSVMLGLPLLMDSTEITIPTLKRLCKSILKKNSHIVPSKKTENKDMPLTYETLEQSNKKEICTENALNVKNCPENSLIDSCNISLAKDNDNVPLPLDTLSINDNKLEEECRKERKITPCKKLISSDDAREVTGKLVHADIDTNKQVTVPEKDGIKDSVQKLIDDIDEISENTSEKIMDNRKSIKSSNNDVLHSSNNSNSIDTNKINSDEHIPLYLNDIAEDLDMSVTSSIPSSTCSIEDDDEMLNMKLQISDSDEERIDFSVPVTPKSDRLDCKQCPMSPIAIMLKESTDMSDTYAKDITEDSDKSTDSSDIFANLEEVNEDYNKVGVLVNSVKGTSDDYPEDNLSKTDIVNSSNTSEGRNSFLLNSETVDNSTLKNEEKDSQISNKMNDEMVEDSNTSTEEILSHNETGNSKCQNSSSVTESSSESIQRATSVTLSDHNITLTGKFSSNENVIFKHEKTTSECHELVHKAGMKCDNSFHAKTISDTDKSVNIIFDQQTSNNKAVNLTENILMEENHVQVLTKPEYQKLSLEITDCRKSSALSSEIVPNEVNSEDLLHVVVKKTLNCAMQENKFSKECRKRVEGVICSANKTIQREESETLFSVNMSKDHNADIECERSSVEINYTEKEKLLTESLLSEQIVPHECKKVNGSTVPEAGSEKTDIYNLRGQNIHSAVNQQNLMTNSNTENEVKHSVSASDINNISEKYGDSILKSPDVDIANLDLNSLVNKKIQQETKLCVVEKNNCKGISVVGEKEISNDRSDNQVLRIYDRNMTVNVETNNESIRSKTNPTNKFANDCILTNPDENRKKPSEISEPVTTDSTRLTGRTFNMSTEPKKIGIDLSVKSYSQSSKLIITDEADIQNTLKNKNECISSNSKFVNELSKISSAALPNVIPASGLPENNLQNEITNSQTISSDDAIVDTSVGHCHQNVKLGYFREDSDVAPSDSNITDSTLYKNDHSSRNGPPISDNLDFNYSNLGKKNSESTKMQGNKSFNTPVPKGTFSNEVQLGSHIADSSSHKQIVEQSSTCELPILYHSKWKDNTDKKTSETIEFEKCELSDAHKLVPRGKLIEEEEKNQENKIQNKITCENKFNQHDPTYVHSVTAQNCSKEEKHEKTLNNPTTLSTCLEVSAKEVEFEDCQPNSELILNRIELHNADYEILLDKTKNGHEIEENEFDRHLNKTVLCISSANNDQHSQDTSSQISSEEKNEKLQGGRLLQSISQKLPSEVHVAKEIENLKADIHDSILDPKKTSLQISDTEKEGELNEVVSKKCLGFFLAKGNEEENKPASVIEQNSQIFTESKSKELQEELLQSVSKKLPLKVFMSKENDDRFEGNEIQSNVCDCVPVAKKTSSLICIEGKREMRKEERSEVEELLQSVSKKKASEIDLMEECGKKEKQGKEPLQPNILDSLTDKTVPVLHEKICSVTLTASNNLMDMYEGEDTEDEPNECYSSERVNSISSEFALSESLKNTVSTSVSSEDMEQEIENEDDPLSSAGSDKSKLYKSPGSNFQVSKKAFSETCRMEDDDQISDKKVLCESSEINVLASEKSPSEISRIEKDEDENKTEKYDSSCSVTGCNDYEEETKVQDEISVCSLDKTMLNKSSGDIVYRRTSEVLLKEDDESKENEGKVNVEKMGDNGDQESESIKHKIANSVSCKIVLHGLLEKVINSKKVSIENTVDGKTNAGDDLTHLNSSNILSGKSAVLESAEKNLISVKNLKEADVSDTNDCCFTNIQLNETQSTSSDLHVGSIDVSMNNEFVNSSNMSGNDKQLHVLRDDFSVSETSACESTESYQVRSCIVSCESAEFKIHKSVVSPTDNSHKVHNLPVNMLQSDNFQKFESDQVCKKLENKYNNSDICKTASADMDVDSDLHAENKAANCQNLQDSEASMQESEERTLDKKIPEEKQIVLISDAVHSPGSICFEDEDTLEFPGNNMVAEKLNHLERTFESIQNTVHDLNYNLLSPERLSHESELNKFDRKTSDIANGCGKSKGDLSLNISNSIEKHLPLKSDSNNLQDLSFDSSNCKNYKTTNFPNKTVKNETSSPQNCHSPKCRMDDGSNDEIQITEFNISNGTSEFDKQIVTVHPSVDKDSLSKNDSIEPLTVECEKRIQSVSSPQLIESNCNSSKEPLSVDTDMPQLEVISTEISPNGSDSLEMPYLECIKNSESSAFVLEAKLSQDETKNDDEGTLINFVSVLSEDTSKQNGSVAKSSIQNYLHPVQLNTVEKNKSLEDNESIQEVSVSLEANITNENHGNLQTVALLPIAIVPTETKKSFDFKVNTHKHLEKIISLLPATVETAESKTKEHYKESIDEDIEEGSMSPLAVETEVSSKDNQVSHKGYKNEDIQEDLSSPITEKSTEANIYSHILKASSPQMLYDTALSPASREKEKKRTEINTKDTEENSHMHAYEDLTSSPPGNAAGENKNEENETELPVSPNILQVIKSYLGHESTTVQVQVVEVNEEDLPETWESLQIIKSDLEYCSEACEKEVEKSNDNIECVPQTVTLGHEEASIPLPQSETVQNEVGQISPSAGKDSTMLYVGIDASSDLLPADSVSNWPYLEEEVFSDLPIANSDNVDIPCASSSATNSQESLSPGISSNNAMPSDASMAVSGLKCRLSWKKIFALSKANHMNKKADMFYKQANNIVSDKLGSPNSVRNNSDTFNGLNKNKHRKKEIELGPAKIEVRLTPTPPPKGIGLPKKWEVVDGPKLEKSSKMSSGGSSTNGGNTVDVANPVPIVLVKRLILKRRSSDESDVELTAKRQIVSSPDNSSKSESMPSIGENNDIDGDISNSATQVSSERFTELSDSEDDNSSVTSTSSSSSSDDGNSSCSCSTVARKISDTDSKKSKLDSPSSDLNTDVLNCKSKLSCECVDHCKCNNTIDEMSSSSEDRLLPRVIIKRTTGMGSNNYQSFLRSVSSSNECNDHWQPVVRLERSTSLDELAKRITTSNDTNKVGIQHRLKIILKSPQTQPRVHLVPLSLQKSRRHSEPEANQNKHRKSYFSRLNTHHSLIGRWRKRKRYNRKSHFFKSASLSSEPNSSPTHNFTVFNNFTKVQNVRTGSKDAPFSVIDEKEDSTNVDAHKHPTDDEYRVVENKNHTKENVTKITFQRHKKRDILKKNDNKIIHIKFKNCNQDLVLTGEQKDQDNKESSMHNGRISPYVNTRESNVRYSPSTNTRLSPKLNPSTNLTPTFDHCEEGEQQQHSKKISMSATDENENVKSPQHSAEEKNTVVDLLTIPVQNDIDSARNKEANSVNEQLTDNFLSNTQSDDSEAKKKRNSDNACLDSDLPFFQSDRILSISSVKRRRSNMDKSSSQPESSASEERCENSSVCEINNEKPRCDSAAHDGYNQPADPVLSESPDDVTCQACDHVYADGQERAIHIRQHPYHCQRCHLAFKSETEFVGHLSAQHPRTRERHHCLLCERSFPTADQHKLHLTGRTHRHLELTQRRTIHTLFTIFTGRNCPVLSPLSDSELARLNWFPVEPGTIHFYHQATPLQRAVQDLVTRKRGDYESSSPIPSRSFTSAEDNLSSPSTPSSSSSSSSSS